MRNFGNCSAPAEHRDSKTKRLSKSVRDKLLLVKTVDLSTVKMLSSSGTVSLTGRSDFFNTVSYFRATCDTRGSNHSQKEDLI
jgi:hypothetical protein